MESVNTKNLEHLVHKADEFAQLDEITQRALKLAKAIIKDAKEEAEEQKGGEDGAKASGDS